MIFFSPPLQKFNYDFYLTLKPQLYPKYLMELYANKMGYRFNLNKPKTLNEVIQYLKIYDNQPIKSVLTDKTKSPAFIEAILNTKKYTKETYQIHNSFDEIDFNTLPDKFVIKLNNQSKVVAYIYKKEEFLNEHFEEVKKYFDEKIKINYAFVNGFELQYQNIEPKIIVERLYPKVEEIQIICSDGKPLFLTHIDLKKGIFDEQIELNENTKPLKDISSPNIMETMIENAKILSKGFRLVRVDFMLIDKQYIFFQELTFTPYSGFAGKHIYAFYLEKYGKMINLGNTK